MNLLSFIEFNKTINFETVLLCFLGYLLILWTLIALWIARDAYKRYERKLPAIIWFIAVFILNIPAWMLYLIIRPEDVSGNNGVQMNTGVNIPMANFIDKDNKVVMGIQLHLNADTLTQAVRDMTVDVNWVSTDSAKQSTVTSSNPETVSPVKTSKAPLEKMKTAVSTSKKSLQEKFAKLAEKRKKAAEARAAKKAEAKAKAAEKAAAEAAAKATKEESATVENPETSNTQTAEVKVELKEEAPQEQKTDTEPKSEPESEKKEPAV